MGKLTQAQQAILRAIVDGDDKSFDTQSIEFQDLQRQGLAYGREDEWGELYIYATSAGRDMLSAAQVKPMEADGTKPS